MDEILMQKLEENECLLATGYESALIGITEGPNPVAVYDTDECIRCLMEEDEELTSLTPNEIGDEERADSFNENKKFNFKSMIKEALTPNYLK